MTERRSALASSLAILVFAAACGSGSQVVVDEAPASETPAEEATPQPDEPAPEPERTPAPGEDLESVLFAFATAWGTQDVEALSTFALPGAIDIALGTGPGEVSVVWDQDRCGVTSPGEGACESLFLPEGQTECCAQIWDIRYTNDENGVLTITELVFGGDAG